MFSPLTEIFANFLHCINCVVLLYNFAAILTISDQPYQLLLIFCLYTNLKYTMTHTNTHAQNRCKR